MKTRSIITLLTVVVSMCLFAGCESSSHKDKDHGSGSYAGLWTGKVCGRNLSMNIVQNGTALSGSYTFSDPTFTENFRGTVSREKPSASASLIAGAGRHFEITFKSYNSFSGGFYNGAEKTCDVNATK